MNLIRLFQPISIGPMALKNRIVLLAMGTRLFDKGGKITRRWVDFLIARAKGGAGLIMTPAFPVPVGGMRNLLGLFDDQPIPLLQNVTKEIHDFGAKAAVQLLMQNAWEKEAGQPVEHIGPSPIAKRRGRPIPRELTIEEIRTLTGAFGDAARRARQAGFDAVEIHAGIGYLVNQFLSPVTNQRTDDYGGSFEKRLRFLLDIIKDIKEKVGQEYPLLCRFSADEFMDGGYTLKETTKIAAILEEAGVHALNVQAGWHESKVPLVQSVVAPGAYAYLAEAIKKAVKIPVIAAYRINSPLVAEQILSEGKADLVGMARSLLADPDLPNKAREGRFEEIRPCIACGRCLDNTFGIEEPISCSVNPFLGKEAEIVIKPVQQKKKVYIAGGGPAGLEAARAAAELGHFVTLWEKGNALGGALLAAGVPPHKEELTVFIRFLVHQAKKTGVKFRLGELLSAERVKEDQPDVVIIATGASPLIPAIPGIDGPNVVPAVDVLLGHREVDGVAVVIGGGMVGCETSLYLAGQGRKVVVVEMLERIANDVGPSIRWVTLKELTTAGVKLETRGKVVSIQNKGVQISRDGVVGFIPADTVILAAGMVPNRELPESFSDQVKTIMIGDAVSPRRIKEAISEGLRAGLIDY